MAFLSKLRETVNENEVWTTSSDNNYKQGVMQILMDNPGAWALSVVNARRDAYAPPGVMDVEMSIKILDPAVGQQFYSALSGVIQSQPIGMPAWNPSLTVTATRLGDEVDEDKDTKSSFRTQDEGKYVTSFKEAM